MNVLLFWFVFGCSASFMWRPFFAVRGNVLHDIGHFMGFLNQQSYILIDIGTSESRILLFKFFTKNYPSFIKLKSVKVAKWSEETEESDPAKFLTVVSNLLCNILSKIQHQAWQKIPISVMVENEHCNAKNILNAILKHLKKTQYFVQEQPSMLLTSQQKQLLLWATLNFARGNFNGKKANINTVTLLNIQNTYSGVSFANDFINEKVENEFLQEITIGSKTYKVYSEWEPNLGVFNMRKRIFEEQNNNKNSSVYISHCIPPLLEFEWQFNNQKYQIMSSKNPNVLNATGNNKQLFTPVVNYNDCKNIVKKAVQKFSKKTPKLSGKTVYVIKSFYNALFAPVSGKSILEPATTVDIEIRAINECKWPSANKPFLCMDTVYATVLLQEYYGLGAGDEILMVRPKDIHKIDWPLIVAYSNLKPSKS